MGAANSADSTNSASDVGRVVDSQDDSKLEGVSDGSASLLRGVARLIEARDDGGGTYRPVHWFRRLSVVLNSDHT